eukprot:5505700-Prymnesium_polylepis.1
MGEERAASKAYDVREPPRPTHRRHRRHRRHHPQAAPLSAPSSASPNPPPPPLENSTLQKRSRLARDRPRAAQA